VFLILAFGDHAKIAYTVALYELIRSAMKYVLLSVVFILSLSAAARAEDPKLLSEHGVWSAYTFKENGKKVCYMVSKPQKAEGDYTKRGDIFVLISHRPAEGSKNVFSYIAGYSYKQRSNVTVTIDDKDYELFTQGDTAWAPDTDKDNRVTLAIRNGTKMVVSGSSTRGTLTIDTFSLKGSSAAYNAITRACGL
jgi:invasion protein IalB